ncbi:hypothetical protein [Bradyrhizobium sp. USDA 4449]
MSAIVRASHDHDAALGLFVDVLAGTGCRPSQAARLLVERIEAALKQLADLVAGDLQCAEVSRLMRLPGSHNTKDDGWIAVEIIEQNDDRYELSDLEEWLSEQSPVLLRKDRSKAMTAGETNYFTEYAETHTFKPSVDVKARLDAMGYMAGGEANIHQTQLSVTAALLNAGQPIDNSCWPQRASWCRRREPPRRHLEASFRRTRWR